jgi:hypothetical protein
MKVIILSPLGTGRLYAPGNVHGTHFSQSLSQTQRRSADGRIKSMNNHTRDLPTWSAVPQPTTPPRAHKSFLGNLNIPRTQRQTQDVYLTLKYPGFINIRLYLIRDTQWEQSVMAMCLPPKQLNRSEILIAAWLSNQFLYDVVPLARDSWRFERS